MEQGLYFRILEVMGFLTTVALPIVGFLFWIKFAFLVTGPAGLWVRMSMRMKVSLFVVLLSPVAGGWLIARAMMI